MATILPLGTVEKDQKALGEAVRVLEAGGIIIYPTDTIYGLGGNFTKRNTRGRIENIKGRASDSGKHLTVCVSDVAMMSEYADVSDETRRLITAFLPGPLTIVLSQYANDTVGLGFRIPNHPFPLALARAFRKPFYATSANLTGHETKRNVHDILSQLGERASMVDLVIDGGILPERKPSTVVMFRNGELVVVREGAISKEEIRKVLEDS